VRRVLVVSAGFLLLLGVPATGPAQNPGVDSLKRKREALSEQSRAALLQLYALESRLQRARSDLARIDARAASLARQQELARERYRAAQATMQVAQHRLGRQLRILYEQDEPDPFAVLLGATSLAEAIEGLENLSRTARATESVIAQARTARALVAEAQRELTAQADRTQAARAAVAATSASLERAANERRGYLAELSREQELTDAEILSLERRARDAERRAELVAKQAREQAAQTVAPAAEPPADLTTNTGTSTAAAGETPASPEPPPSPAEPPPAPAESVSQGTPTPRSTAPPRPGGTMSVLATGYCLRGTTSTGLPVGPGIVAVDPTVIPLGTRMTIPGYGEGVAADTGGRIRGARIDVWIASCAEAGDFTRTVTITFH
jgi:3D (Asp-Asp-Asp) domain-containing protein/peptidoglycan hydrolase CwlO-like protein